MGHERPLLASSIAPSEPTDSAAFATRQAEHAHCVERARDYINHGKAEATRRAYATSFRPLEAWCAARGARLAAGDAGDDRGLRRGARRRGGATPRSTVGR
jgi:hypothetical protein